MTQMAEIPIKETAAPFLKWVGGKRHLLPVLFEALKEVPAPKRYFEPFVGGGALFFALSRFAWTVDAAVYLSDVNEELVTTYRAVRDEVEGVIAMLKVHAALHSKEHYYAIRGEVPVDKDARAARMIYLNKTCFNGLYRVSKKRGFNVPMGKYKNPAICDAEGLRKASRALQCAELEARDFVWACNQMRNGDFAYFDPPYWESSDTANFTSYALGGFSRADQERLALNLKALTANGVRCLLSNSDTPFTRELYAGFRVDAVSRPGQVSCDGGGRGRVGEILVRNF